MRLWLRIMHRVCAWCGLLWQRLLVLDFWLPLQLEPMNYIERTSISLDIANL